MGMPIIIEIADEIVDQTVLDEVFAYFEYVDKKFSTYKNDSEISQINAGNLTAEEYSSDMLEVLALAEETKNETNGFFDIQKADGTLDPSGIVKGWAIYNAAKILRDKGCRNFYIDAGGDIQAEGLNKHGKLWQIGIRNPLSNDPNQAIVKILSISNGGVATSGTYLRGNHIYNPKEKHRTDNDIVSLTVIGPNVYEADRFATAAFAMGKRGIHFIESLHGFEGYMIDGAGQATLTTGFSKYCSAV